MTDFSDPRTASVYRCYDADDRLLYIGCSHDPAGRIQQHQALYNVRVSTSAYLREHMTRWTADDPLLRYDALEAERLAIRAERPLLNRQWALAEGESA